LEGVRDNLQRAIDLYPYTVVIRNINRFQSWINSGGAENGAQLRLLADDNFEGNMVPRQPELPARIDLF